LADDDGQFKALRPKSNHSHDYKVLEQIIQNMKRMNKTLSLMTIGKVVGALMLITLFFHFVLLNSPLKTVSPDSVRFMHFWQMNADQFQNEGGDAKSALKAVFYSMRSSNNYDLNRGRVVQAIIYGVDGLTRWMLPSPMINAWMIVLLTMNCAMIAWISTRDVLNLPVRMNLFVLGWLVLVTTALVISPVMLVILYAKYVWVTFILCYFVTNSRIMKAVCLAAAAFSDEIGLFATMALTFLNVVRFILLHHDVDSRSNANQSPYIRVLRAGLLGILASLTLLFSYFGISAVLFGGTAPEFLALAASASGGRHFFETAILWSDVNGLLWRAEVLIIGLSLGHPAITRIVGLVVFVAITSGIWKRGKYLMFTEGLANKGFDAQILGWLRDEKWFFYTFWTVMLVLITFAVLRGPNNYSHYSYPAAAVLAVLFIRTLVDIWPARLVSLVLLAILAVHVAMLPKAITVTYNYLNNYLFPDGTVSRDDIDAVNQSVMEFKTNGSSPFFDAFTNGQEIDFSGTWFYSRIRSAESMTDPYFPIQGTVRILLWPDKINSIRYNNNRVFDYKRPKFKDRGPHNTSDCTISEDSAPIGGASRMNSGNAVETPPRQLLNSFGGQR
jgi:hypothetical protein